MGRALTRGGRVTRPLPQRVFCSGHRPMGTLGWRPGLSQNAPSLATSTRAVASSAGWAQTSRRAGSLPSVLAWVCVWARDTARNTRTPGSNCPAHTSRLCSRSIPEVSARLGPPRAWATPVPPQPQAPPHRPGGSWRPTPATQSVRKCASSSTASTPTSGADTGPWLAGQAERQVARTTVGQSRPEAQGRHQPSRPPH